MIILSPLKNPLENRITVLRVYRTICLELDSDVKNWCRLNQKISSFYKQIGGIQTKRVFQKNVFEDKLYGRMVTTYPVEFVPVMINIIKEHLKQ